jgi:4-amino-4-deoxychorismate lyase
MLFTPDLSRCGVAGVMRSVVMELAERSGLPVQVATVRREELAESAEVFLCNSLIGIWPVRCIDDRDYAVGPVTRQLQSALAGLAEQGTAWLSDEIQVSMND